MPENNNKVIACIVVRMKSQRLSEKALIEIKGKPLLYYLIERIKSAKKIDDIVICTSNNPEDAILIEKAQEWGVKSLAGSELDVLSRLVGAAEREGAGHVLRITGDNPLTDPEYCDKIIDAQLAHNNDYTKVSGLPLGTDPQIISLKLLKHLQKTMDDTNKSEYLSFYLDDASKTDEIVSEVLSAEESLMRNYRLTVDTKKDYELINAIFEALYSPGKIFKLADVISLLDSKPNLANLNLEIEQRGREVLNE